MRTSTDMLRLAALAVVLLAAGACAASGSAGDPPAGASGLTIQVLLYSGRPDPLFTITDAARMTQIQQLLAQAKPDPAAGDKKTVLPSILGYKGMLILNPGALGGLPRTIAVYRGAVEVRDGGAPRFLTGGGALESFLVGEAIQSKALDERAIEMLRSAVGGHEPKPPQ